VEKKNVGLSAEEAKQALKEGKKVRPKEWAEDVDKCYLTNDIKETGSIFELYKDDEWELVE